jgi:hypothetical protein
MTPTMTKTKPGARRSRLEIVDDALAKDEAALETAVARVAELAGAEDAAVREAKHADPAKSAYTLGSPAQTARAEREKVERSIEGLQKQILALKAERDGAAAEAAAAELDERTSAAKKLAERELEARRKAADSFVRLVDDWGELAAVLSERSALAAGVGDLVQRVSLFRREAREHWEEVAGFLVEPVPVDLRSFLVEALEATTGERPSDDLGLDELNRHRAGLGLPAEERYVSPSTKALCELYPDLRGTVAVADVSGAPIRRPAGPEIGWPGEAA